MQGDVSLLLLVHAVDACALAFVYFKTLVCFFPRHRLLIKINRLTESQSVKP